MLCIREEEARFATAADDPLGRTQKKESAILKLEKIVSNSQYF